MKVSKIIEECNRAIPQGIEYTSGEHYGPYNIPSLDMDVKNILYCVTPTEKVRQYFIENKYDLLISHHPFILGVPQLIYHTALDCCEGGLNDMWADYLDIAEKDRKHFDANLGWAGKLRKPIEFETLVNKMKAYAGGIDGQIYSTVDVIESVVICTGLGGMVDKQALASGADCYILGEAVRPAEEMGFKAVIEVGHTKSERHGIVFFENLFANHEDRINIVCAPLSIDIFGKEVYKKRVYKS